MSAEGGLVTKGITPSTINGLVAWFDGRKLGAFRDVNGDPVTVDGTEVKYWDSLVNDWTLFQSNNARLQRYKLNSNRGSYDTDSSYNIYGGLSLNGTFGGQTSETTRWCDTFNNSGEVTIICVSSIYDDTLSPVQFYLGAYSTRSFFLGAYYNSSDGVKRWRFNPTLHNISDDEPYEPRRFTPISYFNRPICACMTTTSTQSKYYENNVNVDTVNYSGVYLDLEDYSYSARVAWSTGNAIINNVNHAVLVYNRVLTDDERTGVYEFLKSVYNIIE